MKNIEFKYLNITENDAEFGLWVSTVGFQSIDPGMSYPLKSHPTGYYFIKGIYNRLLLNIL